jgi:MFS family permease
MKNEESREMFLRKSCMRLIFPVSLPKTFDRDLRFLLYSMSLRRIAMGFLMVVRAIYFALLGFSPLTIGFLLSIGTFVSALHHISFGILSDRYGRKPFLLLGGIFSTIRLVIFATTRDFSLLALGQGIGALGEGVGAGQPVVSGYINDKVRSKEKISIFSTLAVTSAIGASVGYSIAGLPQLFQNLFDLDLVSAHAPLFWIGAILSILSVIPILLINDTGPREKRTEKRRKLVNIKSWDAIVRFSIVRSTSGLAWGLIQSLLTLYFFIRFAVGSDVLGPIYAATRIISIFTYLFIPFITSKLGDVGTLVWSRILSAIVTVAFALVDWYPLAVFLLVLFRVILMFSMPVRQTFATGITDPDETATAIGISNFARMGLRSVAPTVAGYMFEAVSLSMPFFIGAALMALNGVLYYTYFRTRKQ